ncbi:MAG: FAD-binding oxidoreductase [Spirulina sp. SIO3F2]|nr:FAD-binding oxidoreductase [Spirulina sp. SIO3F2]
MSLSPTQITSLDRDLSTLEQITEPQQLTKLSLDYYHFSPILTAQLAEKRADRVIRPRTEAEVLQVAKVCVDQRIPLTVRGAGTGNYGQCIPLEGGIVLDLSLMNQIHWVKSGMACVEPGVKLAALDKAARPQGWEIRMYPSTYRTATIGGFIGGGSCGLGSVTYGMLSDRGNLNAVRVVTFEDQPQVLELRGDAVQQVNHAYGTNGIITQLEVPLAPAYPWAELIVTFEDFMTAARFGQSLGDAAGIMKKLVSIMAPPTTRYFAPLQDIIPAGQAAALLMIAESSLEAFQDLVKEFGGTIAAQKTAEEASKGTSLGEFTWNHTTLHARNINPNLTYLQVFYWSCDRVEQLYQHFGDELEFHLEFLRVGDRVIPAGLPLVHYTTEARLNEIIDYHNTQGASIANPHDYTIEGGGSGHENPEQLAFKQRVDPYGLMNPGKMRAWASVQNE